jgi:hypothetical protein
MFTYSTPKGKGGNMCEWLEDINIDNLELVEGEFIANLTVRDNVLDELDWPLVVIVVRKTKVVRQMVVRDGIYGIPNFEGRGTSSVVKWINTNRTVREDSHPQVLRAISFIRMGG